MSKHLAPEHLYQLPSGSQVHPCRLIQRDGSLMWKHALLQHNQLVCLPQTKAHEAHIVKTAQRIEELNSWVSQGLEPWECLMPYLWYDPREPELSEGICLYFYHTLYSNERVYKQLKKHLMDHEALEIRDYFLFFKRC